MDAEIVTFILESVKMGPAHLDQSTSQHLTRIETAGGRPQLCTDIIQNYCSQKDSLSLKLERFKVTVTLLNIAKQTQIGLLSPKKKIATVHHNTADI